MLENFDEGLSLKDLYLFDSFNTFQEDLLRKIDISTDITNQVLDLDFHKIDTFDYSFDVLYKQLISLLMEHYTIYIGLSSQIHYKALKQFLDQKELSYQELSENGQLKEIYPTFGWFYPL